MSNQKKAAKFRSLADAMTPAIEAKMTPAVADQNPTPRRMRILDSMRKDGQRMATVQAKLLAIAELCEQDALPAALAWVKSRKDVEGLLTFERAQGSVSQDAWADARAALQDIGGDAPQEAPKERQVRDLERALIGRKIPGYFPTPPAVVERMMAAAELAPGQRVLEPSAGKGNIAVAVRAAGCEPDVIECCADLVEILALKDFRLVGRDFTSFEGGPYERIVMNPPFERFQDAAHVRRAYDLLAPGGRLVAIVSESPFFRSDRPATEFRAWLDQVNGTSEKLPQGAFEKSERSTGVATRLVVIDKPAAAEAVA